MRCRAAVERGCVGSGEGGWKRGRGKKVSREDNKDH